MTKPKRDYPWTDDQVVTHHYPRAWYGHWFDHGRPSENAVQRAIKFLLDQPTQSAPPQAEAPK
jgi:hypothetical protein